MIGKHILLRRFLNEPKLILLNGFRYCYESLTIQLNITHLFTRLNDETVLFQAIQLSISRLFPLSLNVKLHTLNVRQFYLTHR